MWTLSRKIIPGIKRKLLYLYCAKRVGGLPIGAVAVEIRKQSDDTAMFRYTKTSTSPFDTLEFDLTAVEGSGAKGKMHASMKSYNIYARYLLDVEKIDNLNTYPLPSEDIVDNNRNYRRVIGYAIDVAFISNNFQIRRPSGD